MEDKEIYKKKYGVQWESPEKMSEEKLFPVGKRGFHVKISTFDGSTRCHIRLEFGGLGKGVWYPTKKGVALNFEELQNLMALLPKLSTMMKVRGSDKPKRTGSDDDQKTVKKLKRSEKEEETELQNNEHSRVLYGGEYLVDYDMQA